MCANLENKNQFTFTWKIENFSSCTQKKGVYLKSPVFAAESLDETAWCLWLYPRGNTDAKNGYISCFLYRSEEDRGPLEIECDYRIEMISADGKPIKHLKSMHKFQKGIYWGWTNFIEKNILLKENACSFVDTLTIRCHLMGSIPKTILFSKNVGLTKIGIDQCSFKWTVENLNSSCSDVMKFSCSGTSQIEMTVQAPEDDIKINIRRGEGFSGLQSAICKIALLDMDGEERESRRAEHLFETVVLATTNNSATWEFPTFIKKSQLNAEESKYLKNDSFSLLCEIAVSNGTILEVIQKEQRDSPFVKISTSGADDTVGVLKDLKRMFESKIQTDVKLHVDNQDFVAHKCILSSRSPVFLAMFHKDMTESQTGCVDIPDLEATTVESLLEFMYTGTVVHLDYEIAMKLIVAADKYQVLSLKEKIAEFLMSVLSDSNVCDVLVIADLVQHEGLKTFAVSYIKEHSENILVSEEWTLCAKRNLELATEAFRKVSALLAAESKRDSSD